jgi:hypothetical protein
MPDAARGGEDWRDETQEDYDRACADYIERLRDMTPERVNAHFAKLEWIKNWTGGAAARCIKCGDTVLELKWSADHIEWQCLEPTCRENWHWRKR